MVFKEIFMIVHIMANSAKHINYPFIEFVNNNFDKNNHFFILCSPEKDIQKFENAITKDIFAQEEFFIKKMKEARKIILHGIWYDKLCEILLNNEKFFEKIYWVMWGGDFYFPEKQSLLKKEVIKKIKNFITYIKRDYELVKKWYKADGNYYECFMYPSNLYKEYNIKPKEHNTINIQLGNSADPTNNHIDVFKKLKQYKDENIKIFVPLSYGNQQYAEEVIAKGQEIFRNKFIPLTDFMPFEAYLEFLSEIDIAVFAHKRQQAMGNTITLLGLGKKVYMRSDVTPWQLFEDIDIRIFDVKNIEIELINEQTKKENQQKIKDYFSIENYLQQLKNLFGNE